MSNFWTIAGAICVAQIVLGAVGVWVMTTDWYWNLINKRTEKIMGKF